MKRRRFPYRYLLFIPIIASLIDAITHRYVWPGHYQPLNPRFFMVLWTHSREGTDAWVMLVCFVLIGLLDRREAATKDDGE